MGVSLRRPVSVPKCVYLIITTTTTIINHLIYIAQFDITGILTALSFA